MFLTGPRLCAVTGEDVTQEQLEATVHATEMLPTLLDSEEEV